MCIRVDPSGTSDEGHVSMFSQLACGVYDDNVTWPFLGTVTVELLIQTDPNHCSMVIPFFLLYTIHALAVPGCKTSSSLMMSSSMILPAIHNTSYFRVTVEVDNHKPWLDGTHHSK